jgi:hypothetical protein
MKVTLKRLGVVSSRVGLSNGLRSKEIFGLGGSRSIGRGAGVWLDGCVRVTGLLSGLAGRVSIESRLIQ